MSKQVQVSCVRYGRDKVGCRTYIDGRLYSYSDWSGVSVEQAEQGCYEQVRRDEQAEIERAAVPQDVKNRWRALGDERRAAEVSLNVIRKMLGESISTVSGWEMGHTVPPDDAEGRYRDALATCIAERMTA